MRQPSQKRPILGKEPNYIFSFNFLSFRRLWEKRYTRRFRIVSKKNRGGCCAISLEWRQRAQTRADPTRLRLMAIKNAASPPWEASENSTAMRRGTGADSISCGFGGIFVAIHG
jgi:hypothetical protein